MTIDSRLRGGKAAFVALGIIYTVGLVALMLLSGCTDKRITVKGDKIDHVAPDCPPVPRGKMFTLGPDGDLEEIGDFVILPPLGDEPTPEPTVDDVEEL